MTMMMRTKTRRTHGSLLMTMLVFITFMITTVCFRSVSSFSLSAPFPSPAAARRRRQEQQQHSFTTSTAATSIATSTRLKLSERTLSTTVAERTTSVGRVIESAVIQQPTAAISDEEVELVYNNPKLAAAPSSYQTGLLTIAFCTLVFGSFSPAFSAALHGTGGGGSAPPVLLLNAVVSALAFLGIVVGGPALEQLVPEPETTTTDTTKVEEDSSLLSFLGTTMSPHQRAGLELGFWKFLGVTFNLCGLTLTTSNHGAFLMQLTTLMVPSAQALAGVRIAKQVQVGIGLALAGVVLFTMQPDGANAEIAGSNSMQWLGDVLCVVAAAFYSTYDLRLFHYGKLVSPRKLITSKIFAQAMFSILLCFGWHSGESLSYLSQGDFFQSWTLPAIVLWSALMVNMVVPYCQVYGQQAVGPAVAQTFYATQPLIATVLGFIFLGETIHGWQGWVGGGAFCVALLLAATADPPEETLNVVAGAVGCEEEEDELAAFNNVEVEMSKIVTSRRVPS